MADIDFGAALENFMKSASGQTAAEAMAYERAMQGQKVQQMNQAANTYSSYRPQQQAARMNALSNISTAYQPANNALATLYGGGTGQVPYAARPQGYQPITRGGSGGQQAYRPALPEAANNPWPALQDARNPPGSTVPARPPMPPASTLAPAAGPRPVASSVNPAVKGPSTVSAARPTLSASQLSRAAEVYKPSATKALANTTAAPKSVASLGSGLLSGGSAAKGPSTVSSARPALPAANPQSPVPMLPGMGGAPSGAIQGVGGSGANMGLQPGPSLAPTGMPAQVSPGGGQGPSGVSFQPTQIFNNPFQLPGGFMPGTMPSFSPQLLTELPPTVWAPQVGGEPLPVATQIQPIDPASISFHPSLPTSMGPVSAYPALSSARSQGNISSARPKLSSAQLSRVAQLMKGLS